MNRSRKRMDDLRKNRNSAAQGGSLQFQAWLEGVIQRNLQKYLNQCQQRQGEQVGADAQECLESAALARPYAPDRVVVEAARKTLDILVRERSQTAG